MNNIQDRVNISPSYLENFYFYCSPLTNSRKLSEFHDL